MGGDHPVGLVVYISLTITITEWRMRIRREMNELDSQAHTKAIDSLPNNGAYARLWTMQQEEAAAERVEAA